MSRWFGYWYATGVKPVGIVLGLAIGGIPISSVGFGYRLSVCEHWLALAIGVIPISLCPLATVG
jgi:hypothetical protein